MEFYRFSSRTSTTTWVLSQLLHFVTTVVSCVQCWDSRVNNIENGKNSRWVFFFSFSHHPPDEADEDESHKFHDKFNLFFPAIKAIRVSIEEGPHCSQFSRVDNGVWGKQWMKFLLAFGHGRRFWVFEFLFNSWKKWKKILNWKLTFCFLLPDPFVFFPFLCYSQMARRRLSMWHLQIPFSLPSFCIEWMHNATENEC